MLSVTVTVIGKDPACVGVPESVPFVARVSPAGNVLAVVKVAVPCASLREGLVESCVHRAGSGARFSYGDSLATNDQGIG